MIVDDVIAGASVNAGLASGPTESPSASTGIECISAVSCFVVTRRNKHLSTPIAVSNVNVFFSTPDVLACAGNGSKDVSSLHSIPAAGVAIAHSGTTPSVSIGCPASVGVVHDISQFREASVLVTVPLTFFAA